MKDTEEKKSVRVWEEVGREERIRVKRQRAMKIEEMLGI